MIYVNILNCFNNNHFIHQLDKKRYEGKIEFYENSKKDIVWDYVVVYENIRPNILLKYKEGGLIFISGEPKDSNPYCKKFFKQFDHIISSHAEYKSPKNHLSQQALDYHFGLSFKNRTYKFDYDSLNSMQPMSKKKDISMMCSSKTMLPGHVLRYKLYKELSQKFKDKIDFYGDGIQFLDDKADAIIPYRFHICIENSSVNDYWTEKIADSFLGYAIPIYYGAPNILKYFPEKAIIRINLKNTKESVRIISEILDNPEKIYSERLPYLIEARKLLLDKYNIFPMLESFIAEHPSKDNIKVVQIKPWNLMWQYKLLYLKLRLRRLTYRLLHNSL